MKWTVSLVFAYGSVWTNRHMKTVLLQRGTLWVVDARKSWVFFNYQNDHSMVMKALKYFARFSLWHKKKTCRQYCNDYTISLFPSPPLPFPFSLPHCSSNQRRGHVVDKAILSNYSPCEVFSLFLITSQVLIRICST